MSNTYAAADVDPLLRDLTSQVESALLIAKAATDKLAAAEADRAVVLQKVANLQATATPSLNPSLIDQTLGTLEDLQILVGGREKIAADLTADPNNALRLLSRVATLSAEAPQAGVGHPKSASAFNSKPGSGSDSDGWDLVAKHGA